MIMSRKTVCFILVIACLCLGLGAIWIMAWGKVTGIAHRQKLLRDAFAEFAETHERKFPSRCSDADGVMVSWRRVLLAELRGNLAKVSERRKNRLVIGSAESPFSLPGVPPEVTNYLGVFEERTNEWAGTGGSGRTRGFCLIEWPESNIEVDSCDDVVITDYGVYLERGGRLSEFDPRGMTAVDKFGTQLIPIDITEDELVAYFRNK